MPFVFSAELLADLPIDQRLIEDRRNNPVRGRATTFRLLQQNILAYTFPFIPGFAEAGINNLPFRQLVERATQNALLEGQQLYRADFSVSSSARAKVAGDIFEEVEAAIHWNTAARWNALMCGAAWPIAPRYPHPAVAPSPNRQVAVLSLPRRFDWVRLLTPDARRAIDEVRAELQHHGLSFPTSTPDMLVTLLPAEFRADERFRTELPDLSKPSQRVLDTAYQLLEGRLAADEFLLAIALKKSLRSDRLYQPLYEANVMQILLEGRCGAEQVDFEVHTLDSAGTAAATTYTAASLGLVATAHAAPHRAVRELYQPESATALVRRFLAFLDERTARIA